ncbi:heavy metal translocating P-type ATPase [Metabacillus dongyingensis]|uniref:heavy metal translocating P-type ATPase n=1 Tax=Metabacillus dongyingensis TaxID=2874282 RepID=UPI001CBE9704|nr:heavy metal translocating P-type ATPase [Metabacillus dongyingensis]UAL51886.1 cadmium-translocating P-type ATPase [Metabacillus dongyingensis]
MEAEQSAEKNVYRVQGFTCAGCAGKFERNVKELDGVTDAKVNFGAAKLTVIGKASIDDIEKAGAFEHLKILPEKGAVQAPAEPFLKKYGALLVSALFIIIGYYSLFSYGEGSVPSIAAFIAAIIIGGSSLFITGFKNLIRLEFDMRTLMTIAIIGAAIIGEWSEGAVVVILFAVSEALESYSMDRARKSIRSLMDIAPKEALIRRNGIESSIAVDEIEALDIMIVKPGQKIAMDGLVVKGFSAVNQASITGESIPAEKGPGAEVFAGTLNEEGLLEVQVTKLADDTTIAKIIHLVEEAQAERAPSQAFVDKFAKWYTPAIMAVAFLVAVLPPLFFSAAWDTWIYQGLAVLVVGCPCALVISTPVSIVTAIGNAARNGVLIKGGIYLEELSRIKAVAFDKTGTLTKGAPVVADFEVLQSGISENDLFKLVSALEYRSQHPLASAFIKKAEQQEIDYKSLIVEDFTSLTGKGIKGKIDHEWYYVGNISLFEEMGLTFEGELKNKVDSLQKQGKTVMLAGTNEMLLAVLAVADEVRESSVRVVKQLKELGIQKTIMLTGDHANTAAAIGNQLEVSEIYAELLPQHKLDAVKKMQREYGAAAMVGDGVNDAPALAAASVGIAMGGAGTDTALETADVALMGDDLKKLPFAIELSRKTLVIIKQNIAFALGLKLLALLLVVPGWLTLWIAIFADMGATLLVTLNGLRLLRVKGKRDSQIL